MDDQKPSEISEIDVLKLEKMQLQLNNIELSKQLLHASIEAFHKELNTKYELTSSDQVDFTTRKITRG